LPTEPRSLLHYVKGRYMNDPEFHAKVEMVLKIMERTHEELTPDEMGLITTAAALGLAMEWVDVATGALLDH